MLCNLLELMPFFQVWKYRILRPLTPLGGFVWQGHRWLFWSFDYCQQDDLISFYFGAVFILFIWMMFFTFGPQWPHRDLWPHHRLCVSSGQGTGHQNQNHMSEIMWKRPVARKKEAETSTKQDPTRLRRQGKEKWKQHFTIPRHFSLEPRLSFLMAESKTTMHSSENIFSKYYFYFI